MRARWRGSRSRSEGEEQGGGGRTVTRVWKTAARAAMADTQARSQPPFSGRKDEDRYYPAIFQRFLAVGWTLPVSSEVSWRRAKRLRAGGMPKKSKKKKEGTSGGPAEEEVWRPACMHNPCRHAVVPDQRRAIARLGGCRRTTTTRSSTSAQSAGSICASSL